MIHEKRLALTSYLSSLLSKGRAVFSDTQAVEALGVSRGAFQDAAQRLQRRHQLLSPRRGFYVIVPPQYASWGAPPPSWYIDPLMKHEERPYYVGLLKAAELYGATHQAVMEFQVVTNTRLPKIRAGRNLIVFYYRKDISVVGKGITSRKTDTGSMNVSSPELTALDLVRYSHAAGGMDNLATVLADLAANMESQKLASLSTSTERSVVQRLGHLLDRLGHDDRATPLFEALQRRRSIPWVELDPKETSDPDFAPPPQEKDERWRVIVRRRPEIDQ